MTFKELLISENMSGYELAKRTTLDQSTISKLKTGERTIDSLGYIKKIELFCILGDGFLTALREEVENKLIGEQDYEV